MEQDVNTMEVDTSFAQHCAKKQCGILLGGRVKINISEK